MRVQHNNTPEHLEQNAGVPEHPKQNACRDLNERHATPVPAFTPVGRRRVRRARRQGVLLARRILTRQGRRLAGSARHLCRTSPFRLQDALSAQRRRGLRLKRWGWLWGLVMISRRRTVVFPLPGPLSLNGVRIWIACAALAVWGLTRV